MISKKISLYPDTSIFGGYYDDVFMQDTRLLFEKLKEGKYNVFVSSLTQTELKNAPTDIGVWIFIHRRSWGFMIDINEEFRCDCIAMTRSIKDKLDAEFAAMKVGEVSPYLEKSALELREYLSQARVTK